MQASIGSGSLLASLEQQAIPRADGQGCNLGQGIRPGLEDDQQHPNGRCHLNQPMESLSRLVPCKKKKERKEGKKDRKTERKNE